MKHLVHISIIVLLAGFFYYPSLHNDYIWDDDEYVYNNLTVQSPEGLKEIWLSYEMPQYYPMVFTTFWVEHKLWGLNPYGYHAVNLAIHIGNAILIYMILLNLYPALALAAGLLFALHPVQVETVAWITERKNLLGGLFYLLAIFSYVKFFETGRHKYYISSFFAFVLALLSKSITVSFVAVPLFIKWWRGEKIARADIVALVPFCLVGLVCGINTVFLEMYKVGAKGEAWTLSLAEHLILPGQIILFYIAKILYPQELIFFYPKWELDAHQFWQWLPLATVIIVGAVLYRQSKKIGRGAFANYVYFICAIFPALGIFNVYPMRFSYVADHFQYIASINLIILMAGAGALLFERLLRYGNWHPGAKVRAAILYSVLSLFVVFYGMKIIEHSQSFANLESQWQNIIKKNNRSWIAHNNLGIVYRDQGRANAAIEEFKKAIEIDPDNIEGYSNLGVQYYSLDRFDEALVEFENVLKRNKNHAPTYNNMGLIYLNTGQEDKAYVHFLTAIDKNPGLFEGYLNLAEYYQGINQYDQAIKELLIALELSPKAHDAMQALAEIYEKIGQTDNAIHWYQQASTVSP
jgi:protein O-mannosyl-transferase